MKTTNYRHSMFFAVKGFLLSVSVFALMTNSAHAQCKQWDVSGKWKVKLGTGATVDFDIKPSGKYLSATANYEGISGQGADNNVYLTGDKFGLGLIWDTKDTIKETHNEYYAGTIASDGKISGIARVFGHLTEDTSWTSDRPMKCTDRFKPIGRLKITPTTGTTPEAPAEPAPAPVPAPALLRVPGIIATPNNIALMKGKSKGTTTLTWDAGRAHPSAEVWVKVDDEDETKVVATGKGTLQVTVVPGKSYLYILKDAGKTLARVIVEFHR